MMLSCRTGLREIAKSQMNIIKNKSDITLGNGWQFVDTACIHSLPLLGNLASGPFHGEVSDDLRLAIVEQLEVFFMQISDGAGLRVAPHYPDQNQLDVYFERRGFVVRNDFGRRLIGVVRRRRSLLGRGC